MNNSIEAFFHVFCFRLFIVSLMDWFREKRKILKFNIENILCVYIWFTASLNVIEWRTEEEEEKKIFKIILSTKTGLNGLSLCAIVESLSFMYNFVRCVVEKYHKIVYDRYCNICELIAFFPYSFHSLIIHSFHNKKSCVHSAHFWSWRFFCVFMSENIFWVMIAAS